MHWTEPATSDDSHAALEKTLWDAANQRWSNAALKPSEYFLGKFAMSEGQKGGEWSGATWTLPQERPEGERGGAHQFYTPTSIVRLIVEILEPYHGRILDQQGPSTSSRRLPQGGNSGPHFFSSSLNTLRFIRMASPKQSIA